MTLFDVIFHPVRAMALIGRLKGYEARAWELENELSWLEFGPGVKKVEGGWIVRHYPLNVQPVFETLREAIRAGRESE